MAIQLERLGAMGTDKIASISKSALSDWAGHPPSVDFNDDLRPSEQSRTIGLDAFVTLLEKVGEETGRPDLAWGIGQSADYTTRGKVGRAVLGAATLGSAFRRLSNYFPLIQDATDLSLDIGPKWTHLNYRILDPDIWPRAQDALYSLGIYASLLKAAAPDAWNQVDVTVEAKASELKSELTSVVQANVIYESDTNALRFPTALLDCKLSLSPAADKSELTNLSRQLVRKRRATPMSERVQQVIYRDLGENSVNQEIIAQSLGVSSRTLRRKLSDEHISFQDLLDDCRMRAAALDFRTRRTLSLSELALRLGYSEHSTFSRAFARWAGMSPQDYRTQMVH